MKIVNKYNKIRNVEWLFEGDTILLNGKVYIVISQDYKKIGQKTLFINYKLFCINSGQISNDLTIIQHNDTTTSNYYFEEIKYSMFLDNSTHSIEPVKLNGGDVFLYNNSIFIRTNKKGEFDRPCLYYIEALEYETKKVVSFRIEPYSKIVQYYPNAYAEVIRNE